MTERPDELGSFPAKLHQDCVIAFPDTDSIVSSIWTLMSIKRQTTKQSFEAVSFVSKSLERIDL